MPEAARCLSQRERNSVSNGRKRLRAIAEQNEFVNVIDRKRLRGKYIGEDGKRIKPEKQTKPLGIDEFKFHEGYRYSTRIIDIETGHKLWISYGK